MHMLMQVDRGLQQSRRAGQKSGTTTRAVMAKSAYLAIVLPVLGRMKDWQTLPDRYRFRLLEEAVTGAAQQLPGLTERKKLWSRLSSDGSERFDNDQVESLRTLLQLS